MVTFFALPTWVLAQDQYLMTVGGYDRSQACQHCPPWDNKVTLLSLDPNVPVPECLQSLNDFRYLQGSCMANLLGDQPHICGGWSPYGDWMEECFRYDPTQDMWTESGTLLTSRDGPSGFHGCAFSYSHGIVVAGGRGCESANCQGGPGPLPNVDYTMNGQTSGQLAELPEGIQNSCLVALWGGDLFSAGGIDIFWGHTDGPSKKAYIYNNSIKEWIQVADMITPRERLMCGVVLAGDGSQQEVIAAGGANDLQEALDVVEIYSVRDGDWRIGTRLPSPIMEATSVPLDTTFLILGGSNDTIWGSSYPNSDLIYRYDTDKDSWELLDTRLPTAASGVAASMVNSYIFPSCDNE